MLKKMVLSLLTAFALCAAVASFSQAQTPPQVPKLVNANANVKQIYTIQNPGVISWVHIGDLHITTGDEQNYADFQTLIKQTNQYLAQGINFAVLPGDNANEGSEPEYQLIKQATDQLQVPLLAIPGDHDVESGSLDLYTKYMSPVPYQSFTADRYHLIFLNALDARDDTRIGFGLSQEQLAWLTNELDAATHSKLQSVLFMHPFPSDELGDSAQAVLDLIQKNRVLLVEVGHTHFNAVSNDGQTIYAATRSTGQIKEGPVGFSITNLDNGVVSWKFKPLGGWPFVMITLPADKRFITDASNPHQVVRGEIDLRAKIWDDQTITSAMYQVDNSTPQPLTRIGTSNMWSAKWDSAKVSCGDHQLTVTVQGKDGKTSQDRIIVTVNQTGSYLPTQRKPGSDNNSIGIDTDRGLLGTTQQPPPHPGGGPGGGKGKPDKPKSP